MKKSEIYTEAVRAVMRDTKLREDAKMEVLNELLEKRRLELFYEEQAAKNVLEGKAVQA